MFISAFRRKLSQSRFVDPMSDQQRLARRHRSAIGPDALDMSDGRAARYVLNPDERGERHDERKCPTASPRESGAHMRPNPLDDCRESRDGSFHCGRD